MDAETLRKIKALKSKIHETDELIRASYSPVRSPVFSHFQKTGKNYSSPVERALERIEHLNEIREELVKEYWSVVDEVEAWLETLEDGKAVSIIRIHFVCGKSWEETAQIVNGNRRGETVRIYVYRLLQKEQEKSDNAVVQ